MPKLGTGVNFYLLKYDDVLGCMVRVQPARAYFQSLFDELLQAHSAMGVFFFFCIFRG